MFTMKFKTDNAAFNGDTDDCAHEVVQILRRVAKQVEAGEDHGACIDTNGNKVGSWTLIF